MKVWKAESSKAYKLVLTVITLIPFVGPVFYFFINDIPSIQSLDKQDNMPRGGYTQKWDLERDELKKKIKELKDKLDKDENT